MLSRPPRRGRRRDDPKDELVPGVSRGARADDEVREAEPDDEFNEDEPNRWGLARHRIAYRPVPLSPSLAQEIRIAIGTCRYTINNATPETDPQLSVVPGGLPTCRRPGLPQDPADLTGGHILDDVPPD